MLTQTDLWSELNEAERCLSTMVDEGMPSARDLWEKFQALRRRLHHAAPAGKVEVVQRLRAMRDECSAELKQFRPAVERALRIAERVDA
ncbi:MAG: hypothetical protein GTO22_05780 [Gemmatimonadales bacterium]|nr:hypothetical protein [Gemmatimonadales bacterium]